MLQPATPPPITTTRARSLTRGTVRVWHDERNTDTKGDMGMPPVEEVVAAVPAWAGRHVEHDLLKGGLSHSIHVVRVDGERFVLRILNRAVEQALLGIPAEQEIENTVRAARSGVGAQVHEVLPEYPALVLEFIDGETMSLDAVREQANIERIAAACRALHERTPPFVNRFDIFRQLEGFLELCHRHELRIPDGYEERLPTVRRIEAALAARPLPQAPCHNDLLAENFIDTAVGVRIVDWQLSGMNDAAFELGDIAAESDFEPERAEALAAAYFGAAVEPALRARVRLYLLMSNFTWTLWFSVHHGLLEGSQADFDYWAEAADKWAQAVRDLDDPGFGRTLDVAAGGR